MKPPSYGTLNEALNDLRNRGYQTLCRVSRLSKELEMGNNKYPPDELTLKEKYAFRPNQKCEESTLVYVFEASDGNKGLLVDAYCHDTAREDFLAKVPGNKL